MPLPLCVRRYAPACAASPLAHKVLLCFPLAVGQQLPGLSHRRRTYYVLHDFPLYFISKRVPGAIMSPRFALYALLP